jgi:hypothetical protein
MIRGKGSPDQRVAKIFVETALPLDLLKDGELVEPRGCMPYNQDKSKFRSYELK